MSGRRYPEEFKIESNTRAMLLVMLRSDLM
jgi:hypothetical protein